MALDGLYCADVPLSNCSLTSTAGSESWIAGLTGVFRNQISAVDEVQVDFHGLLSENYWKLPVWAPGVGLAGCMIFE